MSFYNCAINVSNESFFFFLGECGNLCPLTQTRVHPNLVCPYELIPQISKTGLEFSCEFSYVILYYSLRGLQF